MKLIFEDGSLDECLVTGLKQIATGEVQFSPQHPPRSLRLVWMDPPTYANLAFIGCGAIQVGDYVMTIQGIKRVARVEE